MTASNVSATVVVETARLRLRTVRDSDAAETARLMTPAVSQWLASWPSPISEDEVAIRISRMRRAAAASHLLCLAIERRDDGAMMGWVTVMRSEDDPSRGNLGYWLGEPYQHHGYMAEAVEAAVAEAFVRFGLDAIEAGAQPDNAPSLRIMRGLGMRPIGPRGVWASAREREEMCDYYEITRAGFTATGTRGPQSGP